MVTKNTKKTKNTKDTKKTKKTTNVTEIVMVSLLAPKKSRKRQIGGRGDGRLTMNDRDTLLKQIKWLNKDGKKTGLYGLKELKLWQTGQKYNNLIFAIDPVVCHDEDSRDPEIVECTGWWSDREKTFKSADELNKYRMQKATIKSGFKFSDLTNRLDQQKKRYIVVRNIEKMKEEEVVDAILNEMQKLQLIKEEEKALNQFDKDELKFKNPTEITYANKDAELRKWTNWVVTNNNLWNEASQEERYIIATHIANSLNKIDKNVFTLDEREEFINDDTTGKELGITLKEETLTGPPKPKTKKIYSRTAQNKSSLKQFHHYDAQPKNFPARMRWVHERLDWLTGNFGETQSAISPTQQEHMKKDLIERGNKLIDRIENDADAKAYIIDLFHKDKDRRYVNAYLGIGYNIAEKKLVSEKPDHSQAKFEEAFPNYWWKNEEIPVEKDWANPPKPLINVKNPQAAQNGGRKSVRKSVRKHRGIVQTGGSAGRLRKGYKYTGRRLKNGQAEIKKVKQTRK